MGNENHFVLVTFMVGMVTARSTNIMFPGTRLSNNSEASSSTALPTQSACGRVQVVRERILNGDPTLLGDWPWMVAVGYKTEDSDKLIWACGGTLITNRHVITAATCTVNTRRLKPHVVRLGDLDLDPDASDGAVPLDVPIQHVTTHERYLNDNKIVNDIAILKLKNRVTYTEFVQPICLPISREMKTIGLENRTSVITGWGSVRQEPGASSNTKLMQADVPVTGREECKRAYASHKSAVIDDTVLCAGFPDGRKDSCRGDSGGPLMLPEGDQFYLMGVTSYGPSTCGRPDQPGVYTRVQYFIDWIVEKINQK